MLLKAIKGRVLEFKQIMERRKIERFAYLIAFAQINGDFPDDLNEKELSEIALWDAVARLVRQTVERVRSEQGVTGIIEPEALAPKGDTNE